MSLPPGVLARRLLQAFPQFILCDAQLSAALADYFDQASAVFDLVQWLQDNPIQAQAAGNILNPPAAPQTTAAPLAADLIAALAPALKSTSAWIAGQADFEGVAWSVERGVVPGPVASQPAGGGWSIATQPPVGGVVFKTITYAVGPSPSFTLVLNNPLPRHLSMYATFFKNGAPVPPAGWTSLLPKTAPASFETADTVYLGLLAPNARVAGLRNPLGDQTLTAPLPSNADSLQLSFGGLGQGGFSTVPDAAGVIATLVLDVFVPWVIAYSGATPAGLSRWYDRLVTDQTLLGQVLASGAFLGDVKGADALYAALAANMTGAVLGAPLADLRAAITKELGKPGEGDFGWVDQLAPAAGWAAQMTTVVVAGGATPQFWVGSTPHSVALPLSPATALTVQISLEPDPALGTWPYAAKIWTVEIAYDGGFTQTETGAVWPAPSARPINVVFGAAPAEGRIAIAAQIKDDAGTVLAVATGSVAPSDPRVQTVQIALSVADSPTSLTSTSRYVRVARLTYDAVNGYEWSAAFAPPRALGPPPGGSGAPGVTALPTLTLQGDELCLGYGWQVSGQPAKACGGNGSGPLNAPYFVQNIGAAVPADQLKTLECGLAAAPQLAYSTAGGGGFYVDTQGEGIFLRPVSFSPGHFDPLERVSVAQFPPQSPNFSVAIHGGRIATLVNTDTGRLQIVTLADRPVSDSQAPMALSHAGAGDRIGLLNGPVAVAATPSGAVLVLEQGAARVQAFDVQANSLPMFAGQCAFALRAGPQATYLDVAVSPDGHIFVLSIQNGGATADDHVVDIYTPSGARLSTCAGIVAAKIALASTLTLYTLDFDTLIGPNGRLEPVLSIWRPQT